MRLEGTLDAFSLPDIFQLLSYTKKTGTLHLRRETDGVAGHGVVHLRDGAVTGARADVQRQALGRRIVGAGVVDDVALAESVARVEQDGSGGLARALAESGSLSEEFGRALAAEQATDAVFDLLRWPEGEFAFVVDELDPDDLGAALSVEEVVAEGRRRLQTWEDADLPPAEAVLALSPTPPADPTITRDEWSLLALVDGRRTVGDLVMLSGRGEYVVVSALAGLAERGLLTVAASSDEVAHRQQLLGRLETVGWGAKEPPLASRAAASALSQPASAPSSLPSPARAPVIPERPEPFTPTRQPDHAEVPAPAYARAAEPAPRQTTSAAPFTSAASVGEVHGATARQPTLEPLAASSIERDPSVNKSLLLRLIAGVRGL